MDSHLRTINIWPCHSGSATKTVSADTRATTSLHTYANMGSLVTYTINGAPLCKFVSQMQDKRESSAYDCMLSNMKKGIKENIKGTTKIDCQILG